MLIDYCICKTANKKIVEFEINDYRIELRCSTCKGLIKWWDESERMKNVVVPFKREWSEEECLAMR